MLFLYILLLSLLSLSIKADLTKRRKESSFSTQLLNEKDLWEFAIKVQIGTPAKEFNLLFDTGSSDTWIPSINCSENNGCPSVMSRFDSSQSSSFKPVDEYSDFHITYDASESKGKYATDVMALNGHSIPDQVLSLVDHSFGPLSAQQEESADDIYLHGIMGAGLATSTVRYQQGGPLHYPFPIHLYKSGVISKPLFSLFMNDQDEGQVVFGDVPDNKHHNMIYTDLSPRTNTHWSVQVKSVQFQNETYSLKFNFYGQTNFLVDTGSNFMYLPKAMALELAHLIDPNVEVLSDNRLAIDCKYQYAPDTITFAFPSSEQSDVYLKIPLSDLIGERKEDGNCFLMYIPSENTAVFGNMLLRKLVTVFDFGKNRIGFSYNDGYKKEDDVDNKDKANISIDININDE